MNSESEQILTAVPLIRASHLNKRFGVKVAVKDMSFQVFPGEIFGFLGPNGAGKTTTIKMLVGLLKPSQGDSKICGYDINQIRNNYAKMLIGYVPDSPNLYDKLTGQELMLLSADLYGLAREGLRDRILGLLDSFNLETAAQELIQSYSRGMKQKLSLCIALLHEPKVLFLDEPTVGLDPAGVRQLRQVLRTFANQEKAVFLNTHVLATAELLCDQVGIVSHGSLVAFGTPDQIRQQAGTTGNLEDAFLKITGEELEVEQLLPTQT